MRARVFILTGALVGGLAAAPAPARVAQEGTGSGNLDHVLNLPHTTADGEAGASGSDIEYYDISDLSDIQGLGPDPATGVEHHGTGLVAAGSSVQLASAPERWSRSRRDLAGRRNPAARG